MKDERLEDLQSLGAPQEVIDQLVSAAEPETADFEVLPENWEAVQFFLRCQTQWRTAGMGGVFGLDYGAVSWLLTLYEVRDQRAMLEDLQVMEAAVLMALAEKRD